MRIASALFVMLSTAGVLACGTAPQESSETAAAAEPSTSGTMDAVAFRQEVERVNAQYVGSFNEGDIAGFAQVYAPDATLYPPGAPAVEGRDAIMQYWQGGHDQAGVGDVTLTTEEAGVNGDTGWEIGTADYTTNEGPAHGRYTVIWKRGSDGQWQWYRDMMSPAPEQPASEPPPAS